MSAPASTRTTAPAASDHAAARPAASRHARDARGGRGRLRRVWTGPPSDPAWARPALLALLTGTGVLYLWALGDNGWANSFYSAAVQAGSVSWEAFFFGASDAAGSITVDKPPASLWVMALSVRLFGLSSWSILVPQALMGVATVAVVHATVRRAVGPVGGLLAGLVLALTPVAALMFRFNNPDALLVLLMSLAAWTTLRGVESGRTRWMVLTGALVGLGFLTKQLQVLLVVPALAGAYLLAAPRSVGRRVLDLLAAGAALIVAAGWWLAVVELWPADSRPYIGGSQTNSILELTLGYNGLGRLTGEEAGSVGGQGGWGETGLGRLVSASYGGQIAWLLPASLVLLALGLVLRGRRPRTDAVRTGLVVWGGWLLTTALVLSFMAGIVHEYYTVALAPAVAALVGTGTVLAWRARHLAWVRAAGGLVVAGTAVWAFVLLGRSADFLPWLRWAVLVLGVAAGAALVLSRLLPRWLAAAAVVLAVLTGLAGPTAYTVQTVATTHTGSIVTAGPQVTGSGGGPGGIGGGMGGGPGGGPGGQDGGAGPGGQDGGGAPPSAPPGSTTPDGTGGATAGAALGTAGTDGGGMRPGVGGVDGGGDGGRPGAGGGGAGGLLDSATPSAEVVAALEADAADYTWVAAAVGSQSAAGYQLATELPVMAVGGFNGSDPSPTLEEFQQLVADGQIHWFITGGMGGGMGASDGGSTASSDITTWVQENFTAQDLGGTTVYDLTATS
ncbi:glycosyltransferase family 39 protein [uncultured Pseudokineococcus sp.]|uniref:glycosyltransferase family 39 protein n=1 Tax=uncultured Pseudokineococcus sp. TaxID=1642928 RepID=UPI0026075630|nr:glycosyltransferase family 39 protein [uncultured Pseudokineococcus sp.]